MVATRKSRTNTLRRIRQYRSMYLLLIPGALFVFVFHYLPMVGIVIAFEDYDIFAGANPLDAMFKSRWVGFDHWITLWSSLEFQQAFRNTLVISLMKIIIGFPIPILLALLMNELKVVSYRRVIQTALYLPHFISWVIVGSIFMSLFGSKGLANLWLQSIGVQKLKFFLDPKLFPWILLISSVWKESGWNTIIYLAAITGVSPELYEAATMDGANRFQSVLHVTLPGILSVIIMMLILRIGGLMSAGFQQVIVMYNPTVYKTGDIIDTYVYRIGLGQMDFSLGTAVGLFNSIVGMILIVSSNALSRKLCDRSIF